MKVFTTALKNTILEIINVFTPTYKTSLQPIKVRVKK